MKGYHDTRFTHDPRRDVLWRTLCESSFQQHVGPGACVLEMGAGYCHFINHIRADRRIALDQWAGAAEYAAEGVEFHAGSVTDLAFLDDASVDFAFASNLFEHLTQAELATVLDGLRPKLKKDGTLNILQPNYRFAASEYFDDYTHVSIWSDRSLADFLIAHGYEVIDVQPRFLPLTVKSRLPVSPALIRLYLALPWKPLGKQMLLRARPARG